MHLNRGTQHDRIYAAQDGLSLCCQQPGRIGLGQIGLVVQDSSGDVLATCDPVAIENNVTVRLRASTVVGNGPTMRVFTPLYLGSSAKTDVLDVRSYRVVGKADKPKASN